MNKLVYPKRADLELWLKVVREELADYLPHFEARWSEMMLSCFETSALHPEGTDLAKIGARIFYKIIKNHYLVDGNKRSAVICMYFFFITNNYRLRINQKILYHLARLVAKDTNPMEVVICDIYEVFVEAMEEKK